MLVSNAAALRNYPKGFDADTFEASSLHSGDNVPCYDECPYESHTVVLTRSPGFGFGFALSGGIDEPPIENGGDRSVYCSDVLRGGPADGKLRLFDRIVSVNGISFANVDNATAVGILRDAGGVATVVVRRRMSAPAEFRGTQHYPSVKTFTLCRKAKNQDFGLVLGVRLYVKGIMPNSPAASGKFPARLHEGDIILKINDISTEDLTLNEARKVLEKARDKLDLTVLPIFQNGNQAETTTDNTSASNDGVHCDNNSVASWSLSSLAPRSNSIQLNGNSYPKNTMNGNRSANCNGNEMNGSDSGVTSATTKGPSDLSPNDENVRVVSFCKEGSVGIRLVGGNRSGVYIADVQPGSVAASAGLISGDMILRVNDIDYRTLTREDAVMHLLQAGKVITMMVEHQPGNMKSFLGAGDGLTPGDMGGSGGDSFYVRANFDFPAGASTDVGQLMFRHGDILHITDTLYNGTIGCWFAARLSPNNMEVERGVIPNLTRAEQMRLVQKRQMSTPSSTESSGHSAFGTLDRASAKLFGRSKPRRAKSLSRDYWDSVANGRQSQANEDDSGASTVNDKRPAYERVRLVEPGSDFRRPVVIYGAVGDLARHRLTTEFPALFECPIGESQLPPGGSNGTGGSANKVIRLRAIRQVMERGRHAVLDITPNSVDKLVDAGFHPIVIFVKSSLDQRQFIKDAQQRLGWHATKSTKKLLSESSRLESSFSHLFSAIVNLTASDQWFVRLRQSIELSQNTAIWVADTCNENKTSVAEKNFEFPNINGNAFVMPNCNSSFGGEDDGDDDSNSQSINGNGWKQQHPFATIRHLRNNNGVNRSAQQKGAHMNGNGLSRETASTASSSALMSSIDTPGSYATLPSRRVLPPPPAPPAPPANNNGNSTAIGNPTTPFSKLPPSQNPRTPSEYANFATLRSPPSALASVAFPPAVPSESAQSSSEFSGHIETAMMASTATTVIEHGVSSAPNHTPNEGHYRTLSNVVSMQATVATNGQYTQAPPTNSTSPENGGRVYPSFYADDLSTDQRQTINTYGTLSRPKHSAGKTSRTNMLAQTDFRSPIMEAKEMEQSIHAAMSEEFNRAPDNNTQSSAMMPSQPPQHGNYAPLSITKMSNGSGSPYMEQSNRVKSINGMANASPSSDQIQHGNYQTPPSPSTANRYASLHLMPRPYRKIPNQFQMLHGSQVETMIDGVVNGGGSMSQGNTPEKPEQSRLATMQAASAGRQLQQRNLWQNVERTSSSSLTTQQQAQPPQKQQSTPSQPPNGQAASAASDPVVLDTVRASVDYAGGTLESKATGVSLTIPRGALPPVVRQEVYFRVCSEPGAIATLRQQANAFDQEHAATPVVMCGPPGLVFRRQVELRLPRAVRLRLSDSAAQPAICYGPVDVDQIMSVFIDHF